MHAAEPTGTTGPTLRFIYKPVPHSLLTWIQHEYTMHASRPGVSWMCCEAHAGALLLPTADLLVPGLTKLKARSVVRPTMPSAKAAPVLRKPGSPSRCVCCSRCCSSCCSLSCRCCSLRKACCSRAPGCYCQQAGEVAARFVFARVDVSGCVRLLGLGSWHFRLQFCCGRHDAPPADSIPPLHQE
jgi:hypothetical protein